jgi:hypothetical protein
MRLETNPAGGREPNVRTKEQKTKNKRPVPLFPNRPDPLFHQNKRTKDLSLCFHAFVSQKACPFVSLHAVAFVGRVNLLMMWLTGAGAAIAG